MQQMALVEKNTVLIEEREKEIIAIVQSISEINEMYRDLATMVVEQVSPALIRQVSIWVRQFICYPGYTVTKTDLFALCMTLITVMEIEPSQIQLNLTTCIQRPPLFNESPLRHVQTALFLVQLHFISGALNRTSGVC